MLESGEPLALSLKVGAQRRRLRPSDIRRLNLDAPTSTLKALLRGLMQQEADLTGGMPDPADRERPTEQWRQRWWSIANDVHYHADRGTPEHRALVKVTLAFLKRAAERNRPPPPVRSELSRRWVE